MARDPSRDTYELTRVWTGGLEVTANWLRSLEACVVNLIPDSAPVFVVELENSTVLRTSRLEDVLALDNARGRRLVRVTAHYAGTTDAQLGACELTLSRNVADPPIRLQLRTSSKEALLPLSKELESLIEGVVTQPARWRWLFTSPSKVDVSPATQISFLIPIGVAIWATRDLLRARRLLAVELVDVTSRSATPSEMVVKFVEYLTAAAELDGRRIIIVMLALAGPLVVWMTEAALRPNDRSASGRHFLINDYVRQWERGLALRDRVVWSGIVGFAVSLASSVVIWLLTK